MPLAGWRGLPSPLLGCGCESSPASRLVAAEPEHVPRCRALVPTATLLALPRVRPVLPRDRTPEAQGGPSSRCPPRQAIFEILTSEFSYQHSLGILVAEFLQSGELQATMTQMERHHLFSNILDVLSASQR